jgi:tight adherence protein B
VVHVLTVAPALIGSLVCAVLLRAARQSESGARARQLRSGDRRRLPRRLRVPLEAALRDADVQLDPETAVQVWLAGTLVVTILCSSLASSMAIPSGLAVLVAGPIGLRLGRTRRERRFAVALPVALEQIAADLRGGGTVAGAVDRLADGIGPVADDLRRIQTRVRLGLGLGDALAGWPADHDGPGVRAAAGALAVAATIGGRAADAIDGLAASQRLRLDAAAEARSLSAQARLSAVVVGAAPVGYLAFSSLIDPRAATALVDTDVGGVCLVVGLTCELLAVLWIRRILRSAA